MYIFVICMILNIKRNLKYFVVQGMGVGQPMIPATLLAGYQARIHAKPEISKISFELLLWKRLWV